MNYIEKLTEILKSAINELDVKVSSSSGILNIENIENFIKLTKEDITEEIDNVLKKILNEEEYNILNGFVGLDFDTRKIIKKIGLTQEQTIILNKIKDKLDNLKLHEDEEILLNEYKIILKKLKNENKDIITYKEIDTILLLMNKYKVSFGIQTKILFEIMNINVNIYNIYKNEVLKDEQIVDDNVLDEDDLLVTAIEEQNLIDLFNKYNLNFDDLNKEYKQKLLKYGDLDKIDNLLKYIRNDRKEIEYILDLKKQSEVFVKIMLYSSKELIEQVCKIIYENTNTSEYSNIIRKNVSLLFPPVRTTNARFGITRGDGVKSSVSGAATYFLENTNFLQEKGIDIQKVYEKCISILMDKPSTLKNSIKCLELYSLDLKDISKNSVSIFRYTHVADKLDKAIENGCFEYARKNPSRIDINFYRLKYAKKLHDIHGEGEFNPFIKKQTKLELPSVYTKNSNNFYGDTEEDTFKLYGATEATKKFDNIIVYDEIIENNQSDEIPLDILNNKYIKLLDSSEYYDKNRSYEYNFDGIIISRLKIIRLIETFSKEPNIDFNMNTLMYIITKNTMLSDEEYDLLYKCINKMILNRRI